MLGCFVELNSANQTTGTGGFKNFVECADGVRAKVVTDDNHQMNKMKLAKAKSIRSVGSVFECGICG